MEWVSGVVCGSGVVWSGVVWSGVPCGLEAVFLGKRSVWWPPGPFSLENVVFGGLQGPKHGPVHHDPDPKISLT